MWIETDTYIGPCRRTDKKIRLLNRRKGESMTRDPSVASLIRQLRSNAQDLTDDRKRRRFKLRLAATIKLAQQQRLRKTAQILARMDAQAPEAALKDIRAAMIIDQGLAEAAAALPAQS